MSISLLTFSVLQILVHPHEICFWQVKWIAYLEYFMSDSDNREMIQTLLRFRCMIFLPSILKWKAHNAFPHASFLYCRIYLLCILCLKKCKWIKTPNNWNIFFFLTWLIKEMLTFNTDLPHIEHFLITEELIFPLPFFLVGVPVFCKWWNGTWQSIKVKFCYTLVTTLNLNLFKLDFSLKGAVPMSLN
jgi:hypothetical protein